MQFRLLACQMQQEMMVSRNVRVTGHVAELVLPSVGRLWLLSRGRRVILGDRGVIPVRCLE